MGDVLDWEALLETVGLVTLEVLVLEGLQWEVSAGLALWEQCTLLLLEEVLLEAMGLQEDSVSDNSDLASAMLVVLELDVLVVLELDVLDWEALLETALLVQSTQLFLEEVLSGEVLSEELDMVDLSEELDTVDLLEEMGMEASWLVDLWLAPVSLATLWEVVR